MVVIKENLIAQREPPWKEQGYIPARYRICFLTFLGMMFNYMMRVNLNFSIVAMVKNKDQYNHMNSTGPNEDVCEFGQVEQIKEEYEGDFEWDELTQGTINSSFYWGYIWTQIAGGRMGEKFSASFVFGISLGFAAFFNLLIPVAARISYILLIAVRVLQGLAEGTTFPAVHGLFALWAPPQEHSWLVTLSHNGAKFGVVITYPIAAAIIKSWGWVWTFYLPGALCGVWCVIWFAVVTKSPEDFHWIREAEKNYIAQSIGHTVTSRNISGAPSLPKMAIMKSLPMWAIIVASFGGSIGFYTLLTYLPVYMKNMLQYDMYSNAAFSGFPYLGFMALSLFIGYFADKPRLEKCIKKTWLRKISVFIAHAGPALCLVLVAYNQCNRTFIKILFFIAVFFQGASISGWIVNCLDLAPNFAGTLMGIANTAGSLGGILTPFTIGYLINNQQTFEQWNTVFYIVAGIYGLDSLFYLIFARGEIQPWNYINGRENDEDGDNIHLE